MESIVTEHTDKVLWSDEPEDAYLQQIVMERRKEQYGTYEGADDSLAGDSLMRDLTAYPPPTESLHSVQDGYEVYPNYDSDMPEDQQMSTLSGYTPGRYYADTNSRLGMPQQHVMTPQHQDVSPVEYVYPNIAPHTPPVRDRADTDNNTLSTKEGMFEAEKPKGFLRDSLRNVVVRRALVASLCLFCIFIVIASIGVVQVLQSDDSEASAKAGSDEFEGFPGRDDPVQAFPTTAPVAQPSLAPVFQSEDPTDEGSDVGDATTNAPTGVPTSTPSGSVASPTSSSSSSPAAVISSAQPTQGPTVEDKKPVAQETPTTSSPTQPPTKAPTHGPTIVPTSLPTSLPSTRPSLRPSAASAVPTQPAPIEEVIAFLLLQFPASANATSTLADELSPQYKAAVWLARDPSYPTYTPQKAVQRWVLGSFFYSLGGNDWLESDGWMDYTDECSWYSREKICNGQGEVRELDLRDNDMAGTLPLELGLLSSSLSVLYLNGNAGIHGEIPTELGQLTGLRILRLVRTSLAGSIPTEIGHLTQLLTIGLGRCDLVGPIPTEVGRLQKLDSLGFEDNELTGEIPSEIGNLARLQSLNLGGNELEGIIPSQVGALPRLNAISLARNKLTGSMPDQICNDPNRILRTARVDCAEVLCECCDGCTMQPSSSPSQPPTSIRVAVTNTPSEANLSVWSGNP